jgi:hypothetical protein
VHTADQGFERLVEAENELSRLAGALETIVHDDDLLRAFLALGHRARSHFLAFIHAMEGPAPAAAMSILRPGVEINFLLRFFGRDPALHVRLWIAEGHRQRLTLINEVEGDPLLQERRGREVDEARREALAAGVPGVREKGALLPGARAIVDYLDDPGAREAYTLAYRTLGADVHAGTYTFAKAQFVERVGGLVSFHESTDPDAYLPARTLSLTMFASTLVIVASVLQLPVADAADEVKRRFLHEDLSLAERIRLQEGSSG